MFHVCYDVWWGLQKCWGLQKVPHQSPRDLLHPHLSTASSLTSAPAMLRACPSWVWPSLSSPSQPGISLCSAHAIPMAVSRQSAPTLAQLSPTQLPGMSSGFTSCKESFLISTSECPAWVPPKHPSISQPQPGFPAIFIPSPTRKLVQGQALFLIRVPDTLEILKHLLTE